MSQAADVPRQPAGGITLFLCGDVMTGRGIDQILPHPSKPHLYEAYLRSAVEYVKLAERSSGPIPRPADFTYVWGDALNEFSLMKPDVRIVNLETAITASEDAVIKKGINYRMHPANVPCLTAARIDCCVLANNHVLDWGHTGLEETLSTLRAAGIRTAGAGRDPAEASEPAVVEVPERGRVLVFAWGMGSSGVPHDWAARADRPGVNFLYDLSPETVDRIARQVHEVKRTGDLAVASIHWGANWGFKISDDERQFARSLIEVAGIDVVHGHSSHHIKGIEVYRDRLILYGCGDFLNDYEGISGNEEFRGDLALMYFATLDPATCRLGRLALTPTQTRRFRIGRAPEEGAQWLCDTLNREGKRLGSAVTPAPDGTMRVVWR